LKETNHRTEDGPILGVDMNSPHSQGRHISVHGLSDNSLLQGADRAPSMEMDRREGGSDSDGTDSVSFASSYDDEDDTGSVSHMSAMTGMTGVTGQTYMDNNQWKPRSETTYETLVLTNSEFN